MHEWLRSANGVLVLVHLLLALGIGVKPKNFRLHVISHDPNVWRESNTIGGTKHCPSPSSLAKIYE